MKKPITLVAALVLAIGLPFGQVAVGQDFGQLLSAVEKMEASLKSQIDTEASQRAQDIAKLRQEIAQLKKSAPAAPDNAALAKLEREIVNLKKQYASLASAAPTGGSFAIGFNESGKDEITLLGADLQYSFFHFELKGEYIYHSSNRSISKENNQGYYFQAIYGLLERAFLVSRYGSFKPYEVDWVGQLSLGAGYAIVEGVEVRFETVLNEDTNNNTNILQLVAGF